MLLLAVNDVSIIVKKMSYIGLGVFSILLILFIILHIWWTKKCVKKVTIDDVDGSSLFRFLKINIFAFFATIWGCGLFSTSMTLFALH